MIGKILLRMGLAISIAANPAFATSEQLSGESKVLIGQAVDAAFRAAKACYSVQYLVFSSIEAKGRGAGKDAAIAAASSRTQMRPELYSAIDLGFEVDRVTDPKVDAFFASCLKKTRAEIEEVILR